MPGVMMQWQISITVRKGLHSLDSLTVRTEYVGYLSDKSYEVYCIGSETAHLSCVTLSVV